MAKSSPEKLAQALRANLKRRKQTQDAAPPPSAPNLAAKPAPKPSKSPSETPYKTGG